ncbi:hypothetical protein Trydic_g18627 [Trypoxylus dichotomus]
MSLAPCGAQTVLVTSPAKPGTGKTTAVSEKRLRLSSPLKPPPKRRDTRAEGDAIKTPLLEEVYPQIHDVEGLYAGINERPASVDPKPVTSSRESQSVYKPVTKEEIAASIGTWANSAPGPDGITIAQVKRCPTSLLEVIFNIVHYRRMALTAWKASRTVLPPKEGDRWDPANWRPLTIGPALQRLLHRIPAKRMGKVVPLHPAQRGFRSTDGTLANLILLEHYAFDTVSHAAILRALRRLNLDLGLQDYIWGTLADAHTTISMGGHYTRSIHMNNGVKQGDPLSPFLFNAVLNELIGILNERQPGGTLTPECRVSTMAFADDILLLEDRDLDIPISLRTTMGFLSASGMDLNPSKCSSISASVVSRKSVSKEICLK